MTISFYNSRGEFTSELMGSEVGIELTKQRVPDPWVEGSWFGKPFYVVDDEAVPRPENPATLTGYTLTGVPVPATVSINDASYETDESVIELEFTQPGTYVVKIVAWPYLDKEFTIENPA